MLYPCNLVPRTNSNIGATQTTITKTSTEANVAAIGRS
jgi:hypothetical protein